MPDLLGNIFSSQNTGIPGDSPIGMPAVIVPEPFSLDLMDESDVRKIRDEVMDRQHQFERIFSSFYIEWHDYAQAWRVQPRVTTQKKPYGLFNSRSGETNRATNTLATLWQRMLTSDDKFFECKADGLDQFGNMVSEADLYGNELVLSKQLQKAQFKRKLRKALGSVALFGSCIAENPYVSKPYGMDKYIEYTDFVVRSLLLTYFDWTAFEIEASDWIAFTDFPTKDRLRFYASQDPETWSKKNIEEAIDAIGKSASASSQGGGGQSAYSRFLQRRQRAGYQLLDMPICDMTTYHGRIDTENPVVQKYWESNGLEGDPKNSDFTVGIVNGEKTVRFHRTPMGTWHHVAKVAHHVEFELEPVGYGVGKFGSRYQKEIDITQSRASDTLAFSLYNMWLVGRYAGLKPQQMVVRPNGFVEVEDVTQFEKLVPQIEAIGQALAMMTAWKEDFRAITQATSNLQAAVTKATATEASITQTEAIRSNSVTAEIIAETFIRDYLETCHVNNVNLLDSEVWVEVGGVQPFRSYNKNNLPINVGFNIKVTTDKDFRPERTQKLIEFIQFATSIRNVMPDQINIEPFIFELAHSLGINPRRLQFPQGIQNQLTDMMRKAMMLKQNPALMNQAQSETTGAMAGSEGGPDNISTPVGPVPTSSNSPMLQMA